MPYYFEDGIWLFYSQIAASYNVTDKLEISGELGIDAGDIFSTTSFVFSAKYNLFNKRFE
jgi:hypothetical protein